jgi:hypothetical protein
MDIQTDEKIDKPYKKTNELMVRWTKTDGQPDRWTDGQLRRWIDEQMERRDKEQTNRQID